MPDAADQPAHPGPLRGLRVVDASTVLAGPYATMLLADLGADVVKVEPPDGDATRTWGPPWVGDAAAGTRTAAYFLAVNRNKRSIRLDLRTPDGGAILRRLLDDADVFVENLRPGTLARLGFDETRLRDTHPGLVHLSDQRLRPRRAGRDPPGYDFVIQAASGLMSITGDADADGGHPTKVGVAISDVVTGLYRRSGSWRRCSSATGPGAASGSTPRCSIRPRVLVNQAQNGFVTGHAPGRRGNAHPNIVPYETFATADGELAVAVGLRAPVGPAVRGPRAAEPGHRPALRDQRRPRRAPRRAAADPGRDPRDATSADLAGRPGAAEVPSGPIADILDRVRLAGGGGPRHDATVEHPALGRPATGGHPASLRADAGGHPERTAAAR